MIAYFKNIFLCEWECHILRTDRWKSKVKTRKTVIFHGNQGQLFQFCPGRIEAPLLHIPDPNYLSFYLKCPRKYQKTYNFDIFPTLSQIRTFPPPKFWGNPQFDHTRMCILLKLDYAKFGVSNSFFQMLSKKNVWGVGSTLGKGRVKLFSTKGSPIDRAW